MSENIVMNHNEDYKIWDSLRDTAKKQRGPVGWVQMYLDKKKVFEGNNLIVAQGREFVAQKIFNINNKEDASLRPDYRNHTISHFAVGSGGATVAGDDVTLNGPEITDTYLAEPISLGDAAYLNEPSSYTASGESPLVHTYEDAVKPITTHGELFLEPVTYDATEYYTKVKCSCIIPAGEPSVIDAAASVEISEAGLYFVNGSDVKMFAHICFAPKWKEKESQLTIYWFILC